MIDMDRQMSHHPTCTGTFIHMVTWSVWDSEIDWKPNETQTLPSGLRMSWRFGTSSKHMQKLGLALTPERSN